MLSVWLKKHEASECQFAIYKCNKCLLKKRTIKWSWSTKHEEAFSKIKKYLASDKVLAHLLNANAIIILTADVFPNGLGAILSHVGVDGLERPISFASRILTTAEKKYSQIKIEATAIIKGIKSFH